MSLPLLNETFKNLKENSFVQNFIKELSNNMESNMKNQKNELSIIEDILSKNKLTTANKNAIIFNEDSVILEYAKKAKKETIYFVKDNKKTYWLKNKKYYDNNFYTVLKAKNGKIEKMVINKNDMPNNISINDVFEVENGKYIIDNLATNELKENIIKMAEEIIEKQNINLNENRKEGHLYMVSEELGNNCFLLDLTDSSTIEFEEVKVQKELLERVTEGAILKFTNGKYEYYSNDGFERLDKIKRK